MTKRTIEQILQYCQQRAKEYRKAAKEADDRDPNESSNWYLEPVADAYKDVIDYITGE